LERLTQENEKLRKAPALNERLFDGTQAEWEMAELLDDAGVPFEKIGWDYYDNSLEIYGVDNDYRLSPEVKKIIFDAGFSVCYVNHRDGWETHYGGPGSEGSRVNYGRKRETLGQPGKEKG
jgi:hypothetical protein